MSESVSSDACPRPTTGSKTSREVGDVVQRLVRETERLARLDRKVEEEEQRKAQMQQRAATQARRRAERAAADVRGRPGRLSALSVSRRK